MTEENKVEKQTIRNLKRSLLHLNQNIINNGEKKAVIKERINNDMKEIEEIEDFLYKLNVSLATINDKINYDELKKELLND